MCQGQSPNRITMEKGISNGGRDEDEDEFHRIPIK
jgi:hypothetical protein